MGSILVVGYGNDSRRDDGVAFHVVDALRRRFGLEPGVCDEDDPDRTAPLATLCVHQLAPELAEALSDRQAVVFADAHVEGVGWEPVNWQELQPAMSAGMVSHHLKPQALLALCQQVYGRAPRAYALSILGTDFDFGEELSPGTAARAKEALGRLLAFLAAEGVRPPDA